MDLNHQAPMHYEYVAESNNLSSIENQKRKGLRLMSQLEGWCSTQKASILMDLVLLTKPKKVVEIGVFGGKSLVPMAYAVKMNGRGKVYGIDPWKSDESAKGMEGANHDYWANVDHEKIYRNLVDKLKEFNLTDVTKLIKSTSADAQLINNIDILHIDGNHSEEASLLDAKKWLPQVRKGGIVIFDDITWGTTSAAVDYVDEICTRLVIYQGDNAWGIWVKP